MEDIAGTLAKELLEMDQLSELVAARKVMLLAELASSYSLTDDDVVEALVEKQIPMGDGAPSVSEFLCLEVAGLLRCTPAAAGGKIADAVNLKHRHPHMYARMRDLEVDADRACAAARKCQHLPQEVAEQATDAWLKTQHRHGWTAAMNRLDKEIANAAPEVAAARERRTRTQLGVHVWGLHEGTMNLTGRLETLDARYLDAAMERIAEILGAEHPSTTKEVLRAKALGVLANPGYALALLQQAAQPSLPDTPEVPPEDGAQRHDPHGCRGHLCGTITTPLHKLRPQLGIAVHLNVDALGNLEGAARVEKAGHITTATLAEELAGVDVKVLPVIDLDNLPAEERYVPSTSMRRAAELAAPYEPFPYSTRLTHGLDLDHTVAFRCGQPAQTRLGNLAPLSRRAHRAKTAGHWRVEQPRPMVVLWDSPLGFQYEVHPTAGTRRVVPVPRVELPAELEALLKKVRKRRRTGKPMRAPWCAQRGSNPRPEA